MLCASESAKQEALCALKVIGSASIWLCVCASIPQWNCVLPFPAGTDLSLSNEYKNTPWILQEGSLTGRTPDTVKAEVSEVRGRSNLVVAVCHYCGV